MIDTTRLLKVGVAWTTIVYAVCFVGVALFPSVRPLFMQYALHTSADIVTNAATFSTFIVGLIIWDVIAVLALVLAGTLWNTIKR